MSHTRRASSQIRMDQAGAVTAVPVEELAADPNLQPDAPVRTEQVNKIPGKSDSVVARDAAGPAASARDIVAERLDNPLNAAQLMAVKQPIPGGTLSPVFVERELARMSADGFSEHSQRRFIDEIKKQSKLKGLNALPAGQKRFAMSDEQKTDLAYVAGLVRKASSDEPSTPVGNRTPGDAPYDLQPLSEFFSEHGQRLRWFDAFDKSVHFSNLDRSSFRSRVHAVLDLVKANGGAIDKPQLDNLLGMLVNVKDIDDMKYARHEVNRRVIAGQLVIPEVVHLTTENPVTHKKETKEVFLRKRFDDFMGERLVDQVDANQIALEAFMMRKALKNAYSRELGDGVDRTALEQAVETARERLQASIDLAASQKNPDALFAARRVVCRQLGDKCGLPEGASLRDELLASIDARVGDKLDRHARNLEIDAKLASGEFDHAQAAVARLGVAVSATRTEYRAALPRLETFLDVKISVALFQAMAETEATIARNMSSDEYDSQGNVIRTEAERARKEHERLMDLRLYEMRILEDAQRLRQQNETVRFGDERLKRAQTSQIVVKRDDGRVDGARRDTRLVNFKRVEHRALVVSVLYKGREVRRIGAQTAYSGGLNRLTTARSPLEVGRALGQMNQYAGEVAKNSGSVH